MADEETKNTTEEVKCEECKCVGWKVGFAIFVVLSVIMFILCIVLWVKRNAIHDAVYGKLGNKLSSFGSRLTESSKKVHGRNTLKADGGFGEMVDGYEGGFEELSPMYSSSAF